MCVGVSQCEGRDPSGGQQGSRRGRGRNKPPHISDQNTPITVINLVSWQPHRHHHPLSFYFEIFTDWTSNRKQKLLNLRLGTGRRLDMCDIMQFFLSKPLHNKTVWGGWCALFWKVIKSKSSVWVLNAWWSSEINQDQYQIMDPLTGLCV